MDGLEGYRVKMKIKLVMGLAVVAALLATGCSPKPKRPLPGSEQSGAMVDNDGQHSHGADSHLHGNVPGQRNDGSGSSAGQGSSGAGFGNGAGADGSGQSSGFGQDGFGGFSNGSGGVVNNGQGGFGSGSAFGGNTKSSYTPADLRDSSSILAQRIIYFSYNQASIAPEFRQILDAHASLLKDFPDLNVRLEGHADERGSREYNVALSERRAFAVRDYLQIKGVQRGQTDVVGYGEEVPATFGHGEGAWSKNRRVEIIYAGE